MKTGTLLVVASIITMANAAPLQTAALLSKRDAVWANHTFLEVLDYTDGKTPLPIKLGVQQQRDYEIGEWCRIIDMAEYSDKTWDIFTNGEPDGQRRERGWPFKVHCTKSVKHITWDIKRIGRTWNCGELSIKQAFTYTKDTTEAYKVKVEASAAVGGFKASAGFEYETTMKTTKGKSGEVACKASNNEKTCWVGAPALVEAIVWEGWMIYPTDDSSPENFPMAFANEYGYDAKAGMTWIGKDEGRENNGLTDVREVARYSFDARFDEGMVSWVLTGNECDEIDPYGQWSATWEDM